MLILLFWSLFIFYVILFEGDKHFPAILQDFIVGIKFNKSRMAVWKQKLQNILENIRYNIRLE